MPHCELHAIELCIYHMFASTGMPPREKLILCSFYHDFV